MKSTDSQAHVVSIHEASPEYLATDEEELCDYLVAKYQNQLPLNDDAKHEFRRDHLLLAETVRQNLVKRKASVFSTGKSTGSNWDASEVA